MKRHKIVKDFVYAYASVICHMYDIVGDCSEYAVALSACVIHYGCGQTLNHLLGHDIGSRDDARHHSRQLPSGYDTGWILDAGCVRSMILIPRASERWRQCAFSESFIA